MDSKKENLLLIYKYERKTILLKSRMKINEFKLAYGQINPNANMYSLDFDAERMFVLLFLFFLWF